MPSLDAHFTRTHEVMTQADESIFTLADFITLLALQEAATAPAANHKNDVAAQVQ